jgi:hypothetical protein
MAGTPYVMAIHAQYFNGFLEGVYDPRYEGFWADIQLCPGGTEIPWDSQAPNWDNPGIAEMTDWCKWFGVPEPASIIEPALGTPVFSPPPNSVSNPSYFESVWNSTLLRATVRFPAVNVTLPVGCP